MGEEDRAAGSPALTTEALRKRRRLLRRLRLGLLPGRDQSVVDLSGADGGRAAVKTRHIGLEDRALLQRSEAHAPAQMGAQEEVRGGEPVAHQVLAAPERTLHRVQYI